MTDERFPRDASERSQRDANQRLPRDVVVRAISPLRDFLRTESSSAVLLVLSAVVALAWANSPWSSSYVTLWSHSVRLSVADWALDLDLRHWVNDGLMTLFFLVVGLEIKRELTDGHLKSLRAALLPCLAATAGMLMPALVYLSIAGADEPRGWAIPVATDIALAVGVLSLVARRIPSGVRVFLLALAIVDDIGAIVIIALFYSSGVALGWLGGAAACVAVTVVLRVLKVRALAPHVVLGVGLWLALLESGVHPTIAGVVMGLLAPSSPIDQTHLVDVENPSPNQDDIVESDSPKSARGTVSVAEWLQHLLHPWTSFVVVPIFALANSGIEISSDALANAASSPLSLGIFFGLVLGKPIGIFVSTHLAVRLGVTDAPSGSTARHIVGLGSAAGIGFTVAMFVTELALSNEEAVAQAKTAIFAASLLSAVAAVVIARGAKPVSANREAA